MPTAKKKKSQIWINLAISLGAVIMAFLLGYTATLQTVESKFIDMRFGLRGPLDIKNSPIVIVKIDDQSDESTPERWPWPRSYFAHVIRNLNEAGAAVIGVDVIFDQPDKYGEKSDDELAKVLNTYDNVVLTGKILRTTGRAGSSTFIPPLEKFITPKSHWGLVSLESDNDGFYRRYILADSLDDSLFASFAAEIYQIYKKRPPKDIHIKEDSFTLSDEIIPKYDASSILVNFAGPAYSFPYYSFDNILDTEDFDLLDDYDLDSFDDPGDVELGIPPGLKYSGILKGKIVLIGATMQELHDNFPTPFLETNTDSSTIKQEMPGVEIHANALYTLLKKDYLLQPPLWMSLLIILIALLAVYYLTHKLPTIWSAFLTGVLLILFAAVAVYLFISHNYVLDMVNPMLIIAFSYVGYTLYNYFQTQQEKKALRGAFAYYVPEKVVQEIMNNPEKLTLGGEERVISVIFSDVAGFTSISEKLTPRQLVALLNEYLTAMTDIVLANNGIIDKYEGDAIMAEFGMPVAYDDHPQAACRTALAMQVELARLRKKWKAEGKPEMEARVGINTGEVIVGNMGSQTVFDYTVMGDHVNLGSRLEGANKFYKTKIMISEFTYAYVKNDFYTRPLDLIRVKGKNKPIEVFELIAERSQPLDRKFLEMLSVYQRGIKAYRSRDWKNAIEYFDFCLNLFPDDYPSKLYRKRCIEYKIHEPAPDWDGVTTMTSK